MTHSAPIERTYQVWSDAKEGQIAVRVRFTVEETAGGKRKLFRLSAREEWLHAS